MTSPVLPDQTIGQRFATKQAQSLSGKLSQAYAQGNMPEAQTLSTNLQKFQRRIQPSVVTNQAANQMKDDLMKFATPTVQNPAMTGMQQPQGQNQPAQGTQTPNQPTGIIPPGQQQNANAFQDYTSKNIGGGQVQVIDPNGNVIAQSDIGSFYDTKNAELNKFAGVLNQPAKTQEDTALDDIQQRLTNITNGQYVEQNPFVKKQLDDLHAIYAQRRLEQQKIDAAHKGLLEESAAMSGMSRYSPEFYGGVVARQETEALDRITKLNVEESSLATQIQLAAEDKNWDELAKLNDVVKQNKEMKAKAVNDLMDSATKQTDLLAKKAKLTQDQVVFQQQQEQYKLDKLKENIGLFAEGMITIDENGNVKSPTPQQIQAFLKNAGDTSPEAFQRVSATIAAKTRDLQKMDVEQRTKEIDLSEKMRKLVEGDFSNEIKDYERAKNKGYIPEDMTLSQFSEMMNKAKQKEADPTLQALRMLTLQQRSEVSEGQIVQKATNLPVKLTQPETEMLSRTQQSKDYYIPTLLKMLEGIETGAVVGKTNKYTAKMPLIQYLRDEDLSMFNAMSSYFSQQIVYMNSGKQINETEMKILQQSLPSAELTTSENKKRLGQFSNISKDSFERYLKLKGWTIYGGDNVSDSGQKQNTEERFDDFYLNLSPEDEPLVDKDSDTLNKSGKYNKQQIQEYLLNKYSAFNPVGGDTKEATKISKAIGQYESGGDYNALGPITKTGDRAYGKYQVMGANIPQWTKEALGKSMTPYQFLADEKAQDAVAAYKIEKLYEQHKNLEDVASIWFSGRTAARAGSAKDIIGTSTPKYIKNIRAIYNKIS